MQVESMYIPNGSPWEIDTPDGFVPFDGVRISYSDKNVKFTFSDNSTFSCTQHHEFAGGIIADIVKCGDSLFSKTVVCIENIPAMTPVYDPVNVHSVDHLYYASGMVNHNCILDEFAHVPSNIQEEFFTSVYPTISSGETTKLIMISTPRGYEMFNKIWVEANEGKNDYVPFRVYWHQYPGHDEAWKQQQIANTSQHQWDQEHECLTQGSMHTLISTQKLESMTYKNPLFKTPEGLCVYENPVTQDASGRQHKYIITVDTAQGRELDYSAFSVVDVTEVPYKQVAVYRNNKISPVLYPTIIYHVGKKYNNAYVLVEINDVGVQVAHILHQELEYENVIFVSFKGRRGQQLGGGFGKINTPGVKMSTQVKKIGCSMLKTLVEENKLLINDFDTLSEFRTFVQRGDSFEAEDGHHDDMVMTLVIFGWMSAQPYFKDLSMTNVRININEEHEKMIEEDMLPFGFIMDGINNTNDQIVEDGSVWNRVSEEEDVFRW